MSARRFSPGALTLALALVLTACSPGGDGDAQETDMTPDDVKAQITDLYEASAAIAPDGWDIQGSWLDCSSSSSDLKVRWKLSASRIAPLPGEPADLITQAQKAWQERGHDVKVERDTNLTPPRWILSDPPYLTGTHSDGSYYTLDIGDGLAYFDATSACVPGDILQLNSPTPTP
ncbi:hypothetical protein [Microbacterium sp. SORGH_AS_0888]|uniref:hypothetical protein n=1 Tax=Microbacterium sp. SORGH_AS_0888 TaxID=3041791 RepID=UPI0027872E9B|nr:hypothetical protein [Microbacterium sp. SORGH_AS_0888]MDQ1129716.1 hypothetical protein [Microbacterium sp. SORGH_AS_0888]